MGQEAWKGLSTCRIGPPTGVTGSDDRPGRSHQREGPLVGP